MRLRLFGKKTEEKCCAKFPVCSEHQPQLKRLGELIEGLREFDDDWYAQEIVRLFRNLLAAQKETNHQ